MINNTSEPPFKTYYGNCLKSEQPISKRHMLILKICAGAQKLSAVTDEKKKKTPALCAHSQLLLLLYIDMIDSVSTTDGLRLSPFRRAE